MSDPADGRSDIAERYKKDFWSEANLVFSEPHYRLEKALRIITRIAQGRQCELLDVGCGPAALMRLLPPNIRYHGIDIATHGQVPNVIEADLLKNPIRFGDKRFDIILAQGFFEYVAELQSQKFAEIADILNENGKFIVTYWNYGHRNTKVYFAHSNVRPFSEFRDDLARHFTIDRFFPASHNWYHGAPSMRFNKALNRNLNVNIPFISPKLAVEYFFICSPRR
jgi:SAM-dependent methyltransferase